MWHPPALTLSGLERKPKTCLRTFLVQGTPRDQHFHPVPNTSALCTLPLLLFPFPLLCLLSAPALIPCPPPTPTPPAPPLPAPAPRPLRAGVEECVFSLPCAPPPSPPADQERAELAAGRRHLEARQALYAELQTQLDNCPESVREQLQEQLRRVSSTSPLPRPPRATAPTEESRAVGRDGLAPAVPAGYQGRCCGLEGDRQGWGWRWGVDQRPRQRSPRKDHSQAEQRESGGGRSLSQISLGSTPTTHSSVAWPFGPFRAPPKPRCHCC